MSSTVLSDEDLRDEEGDILRSLPVDYIYRQSADHRVTTAIVTAFCEFLLGCSIHKSLKVPMYAHSPQPGGVSRAALLTHTFFDY
jgi:hypothetical protein